MNAEVLLIADGVVHELAAQTWSRAVAPVRLYVPVFQLGSLDALQVTVVPRAVADAELLDRAGLHRLDYDVDIGFARKVSNPPDPTEIDPLVALLEEFADWFRRNKLSQYPRACCVKASQTPLWDPQKLDGEHVFLAAVTLTYRLTR